MSSHARTDFKNENILQPVTLPSGQVIPNRLVKVAMYEHMASLFGGPPNANHLALYSLWSQGGWGMIVTGNVQVSRDHLTLGRDMIIPQTVDSDTLRCYEALAGTMRPVSEQHCSKGQGSSTPRTLIIMQLSHAGRQSPIVLGGRVPLIPPLAPSALGVGRNGRPSAPLGWFARFMYKIGFPTPRGMSILDIDHIVDRFVLGAKLAHDAGFDGVELHASHGYLLAQFISPKSNIRDDAYSAHHAPLHLLQRIVTSIRKVLPRPFVLGVKLSSSDYVGADSLPNPRAEEEAEDSALAHVVNVARWDMVDFIEISGGDYENPEFMTSGRQAFFTRFSRKARVAVRALKSPSNHPFVLLTGGMRSRAAFEDAHSQGNADLIGVGRGSVLEPKLPLLLKEAYSLQETGISNAGNNNPIDQRFLFQQPTLSYSDTPLVRAATSILRFIGILPLPSLIGAGTSMACLMLDICAHLVAFCIHAIHILTQKFVLYIAVSMVHRLSVKYDTVPGNQTSNQTCPTFATCSDITRQTLDIQVRNIGVWIWCKEPFINLGVRDLPYPSRRGDTWKCAVLSVSFNRAISSSVKSTTLKFANGKVASLGTIAIKRSQQTNPPMTRSGVADFGTTSSDRRMGLFLHRLKILLTVHIEYIDPERNEHVSRGDVMLIPKTENDVVLQQRGIVQVERRVGRNNDTASAFS
ncbi:hypothetical protein B0F90DRAFT_1925132 [Multifurca ochricompacta]|uniref:NADH:flavin oxidoreductase/NADH oxidase N-terminal domain-containing protein n=1 Tax=Multifurca ochricompacta TaxID=376703 RepID=A0AAD4M5T1_9AGAM|nr:hypothetical protein B0F90DRAFT_1925132 [Multifurca ochricompacta]